MTYDKYQKQTDKLLDEREKNKYAINKKALLIFFTYMIELTEKILNQDWISYNDIHQITRTEVRFRYYFFDFDMEEKTFDWFINCMDERVFKKGEKDKLINLNKTYEHNKNTIKTIFYNGHPTIIKENK